MKHDRIRVGIVGLGSRGTGHLHYLVTLKDLQVTAVCDLYEDRAAKGAEIVSATQPAPLCTLDYHDVITSPDVDAVLIFSAWESHIPVAVDAMRAGKAVAMEVGGAYCLEDCFRLVETWEQTRVPFMFLENCCYNKPELMVTAMARNGRFGTVVHCSGAYGHDLRSEVAFGKENRHYRLRNYLSRNAENYPTHDLGPIARLLNINRGNRITRLVSVASKACGMEDYIKKNADKVDPALLSARFRQGDIVNTLLTCANGESILLRLDTTLPRSYDRAFTVRGTNGLYEMSTNSLFFDGDKENWEPQDFYRRVLNNAEELGKPYLPDEWRNITPEQIAAGHGGMDGIMWRSFIHAMQTGSDMPIDVYDAATWMAVTALSEASIAAGGASLEVPDFTTGRWLLRAPRDVVELPTV